MTKFWGVSVMDAWTAEPILVYKYPFTRSGRKIANRVSRHNENLGFPSRVDICYD